MTKSCLQCIIGVRGKLLGSLAIGLLPICVIFLALLNNLEENFKEIERSTLHSVAINTAVDESYRASQAIRKELYRLVLHEKPKELREIISSAQKIEGAVTTFDIFIHALILGSDSEEFKNLDAGLTYAQWVRRGWPDRLTLSDVPPSLQRIAQKAKSQHSHFIKEARELYRLLRKAFFARLEENEAKNSTLLSEATLLLRSIDEQQEKVAQAINTLRDETEKQTLAIILEARQAEKNLIRLYSSIGGIIFILSALASTWFISMVVLRPLTQLLKRIEAVGEGDYRTHLQIQSKDEFGRLATALNEMSHKLLQTTTELQNHRDSLEEEVALRTHELAETIGRLAEARDAANSASEAKSQFLANMSHEIRTPLNGIVSLLVLLKDSELDDEQQEDINTIETCVHTLRTVINDVLDFSKIESGQLFLESRSFSLVESVSHVLALAQSQADRKGVTLEHHFDNNVPLEVMGDSTRLRQVITNLCDNALKFTPESGTIRVEMRLHQVSESGNDVYFRVSDTGIGIPEEKQKTIFEEFQQADTSTTRKYGGTGLGLAICSRLVALMGGELKLESKAGEGSSFYFILPFRHHGMVDEERVS